MSWEQGPPAVGKVLPQVPFESCPIRASLGVLGRKWACLVLRDVAFFGEMTFTRILHNNPGMTPRVLSMRLRDLQKEGLLERAASPESPRGTAYRLTERGKDAVPVLTALIQYGIQHHADRVFEDGRPRDMGEVFPGRQRTLLGRLVQFMDEAETGR